MVHMIAYRFYNGPYYRLLVLKWSILIIIGSIMVHINGSGDDPPDGGKADCDMIGFWLSGLGFEGQVEGTQVVLVEILAFGPLWTQNMILSLRFFNPHIERSTGVDCL